MNVNYVDLCIKDIEDSTVNMYLMKNIKTKVSGIIIIGEHILMIKRPNKGLLANQWEYPSLILFENKSGKNNTNGFVIDNEKMYEKLIQILNKLYWENGGNIIKKTMDYED